MLTVFDRALFAKELKTYRSKNGLNQKFLAEKLNLNRSTVSLFENQQQSPSMDVLNRICELVGRSRDYFFAHEDKDPVLLMMGKMKPEDNETMRNVIERIKIRKKYISLNKRLGE